jgi:hypothetical protein
VFPVAKEWKAEELSLLSTETVLPTIDFGSVPIFENRIVRFVLRNRSNIPTRAQFELESLGAAKLASEGIRSHATTAQSTISRFIIEALLSFSLFLYLDHFHERTERRQRLKHCGESNTAIPICLQWMQPFLPKEKELPLISPFKGSCLPFRG